MTGRSPRRTESSRNQVTDFEDQKSTERDRARKRGSGGGAVAGSRGGAMRGVVRKGRNRADMKFFYFKVDDDEFR